MRSLGYQKLVDAESKAWADVLVTQATAKKARETWLHARENLKKATNA